MAKTSINNIDKAMSGGGRELPSLDMNKFIELADKEKIEADALNDLFREIEDKFKDQGEPGETITDFIKRIDIKELKRIKLSGGGSVVDLSKYRKDKKPTKIKELNLSSVLGPDTPVSSLSEKDKETVLMLLKMSGIGNKE